MLRGATTFLQHLYFSHANPAKKGASQIPSVIIIPGTSCLLRLLPGQLLRAVQLHSHQNPNNHSFPDTECWSVQLMISSEQTCINKANFNMTSDRPRQMQVLCF